MATCYPWGQRQFLNKSGRTEMPSPLICQHLKGIWLTTIGNWILDPDRPFIWNWALVFIACHSTLPVSSLILVRIFYSVYYNYEKIICIRAGFLLHLPWFFGVYYIKEIETIAFPLKVCQTCWIFLKWGFGGWSIKVTMFLLHSAIGIFTQGALER